MRLPIAFHRGFSIPARAFHRIALHRMIIIICKASGYRHLRDRSGKRVIQNIRLVGELAKGWKQTEAIFRQWLSSAAHACINRCFDPRRFMIALPAFFRKQHA
jgi:hypothetical protein